jgi:type IV pilus assembly protein PilQ
VASNSGVAFSLGSIPGIIDLDARLSTLESEGFGKVISSPRISTLDNVAASVVQGAQVPYLSAGAQGTQVQLIDATLSLNVTPHITNADTIFMEVNITNNRPDFSQQVQGQPAIQVKELTTQVLVQNGDTTVLGGVFATDDNQAYGRVPWLHKLPLLGLAFKNTSYSTSRNELLIFITPHIINQTPLADSQ